MRLGAFGKTVRTVGQAAFSDSGYELITSPFASKMAPLLVADSVSGGLCMTCKPASPKTSVCHNA